MRARTPVIWPGCRKPRRQVGFVDQQRGAAVVERKGNLRRLVANAERNRDGAKSQNGKERQDELRPVAEEERDAVARGYSALSEPTGDDRRPRLDLAPTPAIIAANHRLAVRIGRDRRIEEVEQGRRPAAETRHHAIAVMRLAPASRQ